MKPGNPCCCCVCNWMCSTREAPAALVARLKEARETAGHTVTELRRIVAALGPAVLDHLGLEGSLRQPGRPFPQDAFRAVAVPYRSLPGKLPRQAEEVIYRVAQESLQNIAETFPGDSCKPFPAGRR